MLLLLLLLFLLLLLTPDSYNLAARLVNFEENIPNRRLLFAEQNELAY